MESDRRLNRWGLTFTPTVINRLRKLAIYGQPQLSLEHQGTCQTIRRTRCGIGRSHRRRWLLR